MVRIVVASALLASLVGLAPPAAPAEGPFELRIYRAKIAIRGGEKPRDSVLLKAVFPIGVVWNDYDPRSAGLSLTVGGKKVVAIPPVDLQARLTRKLGVGWRYREKRSPERGGVRRFVLEPGAGEFVFKAKKLDLSHLADAGPDSLSVRLVMGAVVCEDEIDLEPNRSGKLWTYRGDAGFVPLPPGGGGGGGGGGEPPPTVLTATEILSGEFSSISTPATYVARSYSDLLAIWSQHSPPMPPGVGAPDVAPPDVDFSKHVLVAIFLGSRMSSGYSVAVTDVEAVGTGAKVTYVESQPAPGCPGLPVVTSPFVFATITRVEGPVTFEGRVTVKNCP